MLKIIDKGDCYVLYNLYTDALVKVMKEDKSIDDLMKDSDFLNFLRNECVYIDKDYNQKYLSRYMINKSKYSDGELMITDALTYKCNLRCVYCMQQNTFKNVTELSPVQRVDIWEQLYKITGSECISICFFGGEPMLNISFIKDELEEAVRRKLDLNKLTIVSNGTLINEEAIELFNKYDFKHIQITLDGIKNTQNSRRISKDKSDVFDRIIANIKKLLEETNIDIIINTVLDKNNMNEYLAMVDFVGDKFSKYVYGKDARVAFNIGQECHPINKSEYTNNNITDSVTYSKNIYKYMNYLIDKGYKINQPLPSPICINRKENDVIISPDGDLYKCISGLGNKEFMLVNKEELFNNPMNYHIKQVELLEQSDNECNECEFMSLCNGGCKYNAYNNGVKKECNKDYLSVSISDIIGVLEKIQSKNGEIAIWNNQN